MSNAGIIYSGFEASQGPGGVYTTKVDNEVIKFRSQLGYLYVEARTADLELLVNNDDDKWYIPIGMSDEIEGMHIIRITVLCPAGTQIYWKGYDALE